MDQETHESFLADIDGEEVDVDQPITTTFGEVVKIEQFTADIPTPFRAVVFCSPTEEESETDQNAGELGQFIDLVDDGLEQKNEGGDVSSD